LRILFDNNVPIGLRRFLPRHEVRTIREMGWPPQLENGELLKAAESEAFDILLTSDQNIKHQQDLKALRLALVVLGSNIWPIVKIHVSEITDEVEKASRGSYHFIEMLPAPRRKP